MQKCLLPAAVQKKRKKKKQKFAKGWQENKDATQRDATRRISVTRWFVVQTPQITLPRSRRRRRRFRPPKPPRMQRKTYTQRTLPPAHVPRLAGAGARGGGGGRGGCPLWRSNPRRKTHVGGGTHRLSGRIMSRCHLCHKSEETKR